MQKLLTAALLATTIFGSVAPALATAQDEYQEHNNLVSALVRNGVKVYLDGDMCKPGLAGFYHSPSMSLVLCNGGSTVMTDDNMDTLRHEAIHAVQDCKDGVQGNRALHHVLKPGAVEELAAATGISLDRIVEVYRSHGQDDYVISLEFEAFTGAAGMSAGTIAKALDTMCAR